MRICLWRAAALASAIGAVGLYGCGSNIPQPQAVQNRVTLQSFSGPSSCADLEQYIEDTAVLDMRTRMEAMKDGSGGWWGWDVARGGDTSEAMAGAPAADGKASSGPSAYTTTNTQVAGVDEADFVKNDGTRIFVLSGQNLFLSRSWPASQLSLAGQLKIEGWPREMFLDEKDHVVIFSQVWEPYALDQRFAGASACSPMYCGYYYSNTVKMTVVDVSDLSLPKVTHEFYLPGSYSNSRRIGSSIRLVLSDQFLFPADVRWWPEYSEGLYEDKGRLSRAIDELMVENEKKIRAHALADWLPESRSLVGGTETKIGYDCSSFYKTNAPTKLGLVTVATLNLDRPEQVGRTSVVAESGEIYASTSSLYVANRHWWWWPQPGQTDATYIHKFDITNPDQAAYVASGQVDGHIVDQFSMDEDQNGYFRIATTIARRVNDPFNRWGRLETTNLLQVLGEDSGSLKVVGKSPELAKGERIFSSRFVGDKGYVVTFRQIDPLFTFDLSDPTQPKPVGELKVPGFSSYIHPIDQDHLLTIGTYIPENNTDWRARALQLTIFDVSDLSSPKQKFVQLVGTAYSWSEAQYEHKAFNYFPEKKLLAIPFFDWKYGTTSSGDYWYSFVSDLRVYGIDTASGITPKGAVSMKDVYQVFNDYGWSYYWQPMVRRSVMADQYVYAISDAGIRVADISNLSSPIATVKFTKSAEK
ncbi:MAG: beta-propeller domain-containing protein [Myxococcales bacterium]|nr:beta-propeller domain-containing protein [Myxococcales bacterium]